MKRILYTVLFLLGLSSFSWGQGNVIVFDRLAQAQTALYLGEGMEVQTRGYYQPFDGGGAKYKVVRTANAPGAVDSGYVIALGTSKRLVQLIENNELRAQTFGVKCGDITSDRSNYFDLQNAINAAVSYGFNVMLPSCGDTVYVEFAAAETLHIPNTGMVRTITIQGITEGMTVFQPTGDPSYNWFSSVDTSKVRFTNVQFIGNFNPADWGGIGGNNQTLSISNDTLSISGGNSVVLPAGGGGPVDSTRLIQDTIVVYYLAGVEVGRDTVRGFLRTELDGDPANEGALTVGPGNAVSASIVSNTPGSTPIQIQAGVGINVSEILGVGGIINIANVGDLSTTNELQNLSWNGSTGELSIASGNTVDLDGRYLESFTETDPIWISDSSNYATKSYVNANSSLQSGPSGSIQFNRADTLAGTDSLKWDWANKVFTVNGIAQIDSALLIGGGNIAALQNNGIVIKSPSYPEFILQTPTTGSSATDGFKLQLGGTGYVDLRYYESGDFRFNTYGPQFIFNSANLNADFRVNDDLGNPMLFVDAGLSRVGIGTATPSSTFHVSSPTETLNTTYSATGTTSVITEKWDASGVYWEKSWDRSSFNSSLIYKWNGVQKMELTKAGALNITGGLSFVGNLGLSPGSKISSSSAELTLSETGTGRYWFRLNNSSNANFEFTQYGGTVLATIKNNGAVGIGTSSPNTSALVDMTSTTKGFLPPRMTSAQRDAITTPATGLMVYNSTDSTYSVRRNSGWENVAFLGDLSIANWNTAYGWGDHSTQGYHQTMTIDSNATTYTLGLSNGNNVKFAKPAAGLTGSGTDNYLARWNSGALTNSVIRDNGTTAAIGIGSGASAFTIAQSFTEGSGSSIPNAAHLSIINNQSLPTFRHSSSGIVYKFKGRGGSAEFSRYIRTLGYAKGGNAFSGFAIQSSGDSSTWTTLLSVDTEGALRLPISSAGEIGYFGSATSSIPGTARHKFTPGGPVGGSTTSGQATVGITGDYSIGLTTTAEESALKIYPVLNSTSTGFYRGIFIDPTITAGNWIAMDVKGPTILKGLGTTSATYALLIEDSGGTDLLKVDNSGSVGIRVSTPSAALDVNGDAIFNSSSGDYDFRVNDDLGNPMIFMDAGLSRVGIGTATPGYVLDILKGGQNIINLTSATSSTVFGLRMGAISSHWEMGFDRSVTGNLTWKYNNVNKMTLYNDGRLTITGGLTFNGNLSMASNLITGNNGSSISVYDGQTGNMILRPSTIDAISKIRFQTGSSSLDRMQINNLGQVSIGTLSPDVSSIFQINSTTLGFLPPRMTSAQRDAIATPAAGLMVYNSTDSTYSVRRNSGWENVAFLGDIKSPGGSTGALQYNNAGAFAGATGADWDEADTELQINTADLGAYTLQVGGNAYIDGSVRMRGMSGGVRTLVGASNTAGTDLYIISQGYAVTLDTDHVENGRIFHIRNTSTISTVVVDTEGSETINGQATYTISTSNLLGVTFVCDGTNWYTF